MWIWPVFKVLGYFAGFYILAAIVFLASARLKKDEKGNLILDPDSWHMKLAYPFARNKPWFRKKMHAKGIGLCPYFSRLLLMIIFAWPFMIALETIKFLVYNPISLLFGYYAVPDLEECYADSDNFLLLARFESLGFGKFLPIYVVAPAIYVWSWHFHHAATVSATKTTGIWLGIVVATIALVVLFVFLTETPQKDISLARAWLSAKWHRWCPTLKVKGVTEEVAEEVVEEDTEEDSIEEG